MSKYFEADKGRWASIFQNEFKGLKPYGITKWQIKSALTKVWSSDYFWFQCVERFGLLDKPSDEIDNKTKEKAAANFWAMLREQI